MIEMILFIVMGVYFASYVFGVMWILMGLFFPHRVFSKKQPNVSVIVAARNEADNIRYCAESLAAQDYPKDQAAGARGGACFGSAEGLSAAGSLAPNTR